MQIIQQPSLRTRTTFKFGGATYQELRITSLQDCEAALLHIQKEARPCFILGGGSNILAYDTIKDYILVRTALPSSITVLRDTPTCCTVQVPASMVLQRCVLHLLKLGCQGVEGLAGIPGTVGGAIAMNAGSFGSTITQFLDTVEVFSFTNAFVSYPKDACIINYRMLEFPEKTPLILSATFTFPKGDATILQKKYKENLTTKQTTQPVHAYSAGCVFKNPSTTSAGKLLDTAGVKDFSTEHCSFSKQHANFLLHDGKGSAEEALYLLEKAYNAVYTIHGIALALEVRLLLPQEYRCFFPQNFFPIQI